MPAVMHKRKRQSGAGIEGGGGDVAAAATGSAKKPFKTRPLTKKKAKANALSNEAKQGSQPVAVDRSALQWRPCKDQAQWLTATFQSVFGSLLAPSEMEPIPEDQVVQLSEGIDHSVEKLGSHVKGIIGSSWKDSLCTEDKARDAGSPVVLVLCSSAIRCVELLRGMKAFTGKVDPAKLFAKHIKLEEQVTLLEKHVNVAAGTPNRVRKLMDIGALGMGSLRLVILDMHCDAKGLTLLTVPQVKADFWELYRAHLHPINEVRLCLY